MSKILLSSFYSQLQKMTVKSDSNSATHEYLTGFDFPESKEDKRRKGISQVVQSLLVHDKLCIARNDLLTIISYFGTEDTISLIQNGVLEIFDDNGFSIALLETKEDGMWEYSPLYREIKDYDANDNSTFLEKRLLTNSKISKSQVDKILLCLTKHEVNFSFEDASQNISNELSYDLGNENIAKSLQLFSKNKKEISPADTLKILRLSHVNKNLVYSEQLRAESILMEGGAKNILYKKVAPALRNKIGTDTVNIFDEVLKKKGLPDIGILYCKGIISMGEILEIRENFEGTLFRKWFHSIDYQEDKFLQILLNKSKYSVRNLISKNIRWIYPNIVGLINPVVGMIASAVDSFIVEKIINGWHPSLFLDDILKETIDNNIKVHEAKIRIEKIKKIYPDIGRNDKCPCGSNKKFKKCCGR